MKVLLGVSRVLVSETGTQQCQRSDDMFEIEIPDDGSEFLGRIWMMADGMEVLGLPLTLGPAMTAVYNKVEARI